MGDERHLIVECAALAFFWPRYADRITGSTDTMMSLFAQPDLLGVFRYVIDCLDFMKFEHDCHNWYKRSALLAGRSLSNSCFSSGIYCHKMQVEYDFE